METKEITMLRKEIAELRAQLDDLVKAQNNDRAEAIKAIASVNADIYKDVFQAIAHIHDYLWPLVSRVFPKWAASEKQIAEFMKGRTPIDGDEKIP